MKIRSWTNNTYSAQSFSKLAERFPSLTQIELEVYSFDICVSIVDLFLSELAKLSYIQVHFTKDTLLRNPFTRAYVFKKRRERFPDGELHEQMVNARKSTEAVLISLS